MSMLPPGKATVTAEMNIRYLRAGNPRTEGVLTARAEVIKPGKALCFAEATVEGGSGRVLAKAGATFYVVDRPRD